MSEQEKAGGIQVIARAAAIMRTLGQHPKGLTLAGIAKEVGLPRSTVQRIITALEEENLAEPVGTGVGFRLGTALGQLMSQTQSDIISIMGPVIRGLVDELNESVTLGTLIGDKVHIIDRGIAERELRIVFPVGIHAPSYATAVGKLLLAHSDNAVLEKLPSNWEKFTPTTLGRDELIVQLAEIREKGFAYDQEEYIEGICSVAISIETYLGTYALAVLAPSSRAAKRTPTYIEALLKAKVSLEENIGTSKKNKLGTH